jgi:UDP-glucose 4-epimerase
MSSYNRAMPAETAPPFDSFYRGRRVCVAGGAGFIGSHLAEALVSHGAIVSIIDDFSSGREQNLAAIADRIRLVRGSILDAGPLAKATSGAEIIFHEAALCSVPGSVAEPARYHEVNASGTVRVLEAARAAGATRVVFAASSSAYGDSPQLPKVESMPPTPISPYAVSKCAGEMMLRAYSHCFGLSTISLRYFNIFGPRQRPDSPYAAVIAKFAQAMTQGRRPVIFGDGKQTRDFTHVSNAVHANLLAGACGKTLRGEVVNIACGKSDNLLALVAAMARLLGVNSEYELAPARVGEALHSLADISAAERLIGYVPITSFEEGLKQTVEHYRREFRGSD